MQWLQVLCLARERCGWSWSWTRCAASSLHRLSGVHPRRHRAGDGRCDAVGRGRFGDGRIDGFVVELNPAGGHNAPPRGFKFDPNSTDGLNDEGEPMYGPKDDVDKIKFLKAAHGLPFWFAGCYGHPDKFCEVLGAGGNGVQVRWPCFYINLLCTLCKNLPVT